MKRTFITLVSAAVLLTAATACYDAIECPDVLRTNDKIKFVPEDNLLTKAPVITFPTDFGITLSASHSSAGSYMVGIPFSRNSSNEWEPSTAKYWPQSGTLSFLGFAKKNLSVSNVSWNADPSYQVTMTVGDNSSLQEDLMFCAAAAVDKRTTAYPLSFSHAMANLQFTVAAPDGAYNSSNNTGITVSSIKLVNVYNSGTMTATRSGASVSYAWSSRGNQKNLTAPGISNASVATTATALGNGLLVVPQTCVGVQIEYVLHNGKDGNGTAVNTTRTYTYTPSGSWTAGSKYTIAFSISQGQVSATTSISAWTNATQNWIFGTGNTVSWVGNDFSFTSGNLNNIWWRLDGSSSYEPLTYVEGTWGSSVKLEAASYYVTLTATGSLYTVSYEGKRRMTGIDFRFASVCHEQGGYQGAKNWYTPTDKGDYDEVILTGFWDRSQPNIYDYVTSFDCIYDDGSRETIDLTQAVNYNNSNIACTSGGTLWTGNFYRNRNGFYSRTSAPFSYNSSDYINQGKTYLDRTFTISYTVNGNTYSATRTLRHQGNLWIVSCSEPSFTSAGQTVELRVYGYCSLGAYEECDLTNYITSVSTTATDMFEVNGTRTFYVKPGISNTVSGPISAVLTASSGNTVTANSTIWGAEATKWINLLVDDDYWRMDDYEHYWDVPYLKKHFNLHWVYNDVPGDVFDFLGYDDSSLATTVVFFVYRCKGDGSLENISNSPELSWSYNQATLGVYSAYEGEGYYGQYYIEPYEWGGGWEWPPHANTSFTNQYVLFSGMNVTNDWIGSELSDYYTPAYEEYNSHAAWYGEPINTFYFEDFINVTYRGHSSHISLIFDPDE